jgi:hypothetical protein
MLIIFVFIIVVMSDLVNVDITYINDVSDIVVMVDLHNKI